MNISIIVPAYNEEKRIAKSLIEIDDFCKNNFENYELIIVDDKSQDNTADVVSYLKFKNVKVLKNLKNMGKGFSVKEGILQARYPLVLFTDSDLPVPLTYLTEFIGYINQDYDIVIASKYMKSSKADAEIPFDRKIKGAIFRSIVKMFVVRKFSDTQCGFKLFKTLAAKKIVKYQTRDRFAFDAELLYIAQKMGYSIREVPVAWQNKKGSKVSLNDALKMLLDVIIISINKLTGRYS